MHHGVATVLSLDLERGPRGEIVEKGSAFNLRRDDVVIHVIVEIGMTAKQLRTGMHLGPFRSGERLTLTV